MANWITSSLPQRSAPPKSMFNRPENRHFGGLTVRSNFAGIWTDDAFTREQVMRANTDDMRPENERAQPQATAEAPR
jgi:hypothetical protein